MTNAVKLYFLFGFLYSLCFCRNIVKDKFTIDKFLTLKELDLKKKNNLGLRLIGLNELGTIAKELHIKEKTRKF